MVCSHTSCSLVNCFEHFHQKLIFPSIFHRKPGPDYLCRPKPIQISILSSPHLNTQLKYASATVTVQKNYEHHCSWTPFLQKYRRSFFDYQHLFSLGGELISCVWLWMITISSMNPCSASRTYLILILFLRLLLFEECSTVECSNVQLFLIRKSSESHHYT